MRPQGWSSYTHLIYQIESIYYFLFIAWQASTEKDFYTDTKHFLTSNYTAQVMCLKKVCARARKAIKDLGALMQPHIHRLDNEQLVAMAATVYNYKTGLRFWNVKFLYASDWYDIIKVVVQLFFNL